MASNLACIGIRVDDMSDLQWLVVEIMKVTTPTVAVRDRFEYRWQDPSGARLSFALENGEVHDLTPSFAGQTSVELGTVAEASNRVFIVDVVDSNGETLTRAAVDPVDESTFRARAESGLPAGVTQFTALGAEVTIHENAEAFLASDASLLLPERSVDDGVSMRFAAESFISYGSFTVEDSNAVAALNGTVIHAERRTVELTGESFIAARVRASEFEVDLCFPSDPDAGVPVPGNVIGGIVYLVATRVDGHGFDPTPPRRMRLGRRIARIFGGS